MTNGAFTVYYDASCPMCRAEIGFYRKRRGAEAIDWVDVSNPRNAPIGLSCEQAMARFHVRNIDGQLINGGAAFAELWKQMPSFRWLGLAFSIPPLRWLLNVAYNLFLPIRPHLQGLFRERGSLSGDPS
ncbi:MAG: thiol-disulfide oxidoreductase DCC family protein [Henriciella sp.]